MTTHTQHSQDWDDGYLQRITHTIGIVSRAVYLTFTLIIQAIYWLNDTLLSVEQDTDGDNHIG